MAATTTPQTWFITGCSSGFGEEMVRQLRKAGDNVIATGRNADTKLAHLRDTGASILDLDVSSPPDVIKAKMDEAWDIYPGGIDVVVNNAGYILSGALEELKPSEMDNIFKTNYFGPFNITQAVLPKLRAKGKGTLLYVSSVAGWHGYGASTGYSSTKFALEAMAECLSRELALMAPGIKVLIAEPGYCSTDCFKKLSMVPPREAHYAQFNAGTRSYVDNVIGNEPGDPVKATSRIVELVKGTGFAEGREVPLRVPLGSDTLEMVRAKCNETLKICDDWEAAAKSTDK